jgi:mono/diheme cytochrome c family protein
MSRIRLLRLGVFSVFIACVLAFADTSDAGVAEGKKIFKAKKCGDCHQTVWPAKEKTIADQLSKKGPELWYVGSKLKKEFLGKWLKDPKPIRPMKYYSLTEKNPGDHPKLGDKDAAEVGAYLMSLTSKDVKKVGIKPKKSPKGRVIFQKKQGCYGCHEFRKGKKIVGGVTGPTLVGASERLQPDWIYAYFVTPKKFKPLKDMPIYVGILTDKEMRALAQFVSSLK